MKEGEEGGKTKEGEEERLEWEEEGGEGEMVCRVLQCEVIRCPCPAWPYVGVS